MLENLFSKLPSLSEKTPEEGVADDLAELEAKRERIDFHRARVRNGPANFKVQTAGQAKRARHRALRRDTKNARKRQIATFQEQQREAAVLRGQLQAVGALPYGEGFAPTDDLRWNALLSILKRFADGPPADEQVVKDAIDQARSRWQSLTGQAA